MDKLSLFPTEDGSVTFWSDTYQETFHSAHGAKHEAEAKFVIPAKIAEKAKSQTQISILDICYGLGYNSAAAIACVSELPDPTAKLQIIALENNLINDINDISEINCYNNKTSIKNNEFIKSIIVKFIVIFLLLILVFLII